jgi:undecaprenyl-diphosphatase
MSIIESVFLAIAQGIAEFLPVSSSFHLIFLRDILGIGSGIGQSPALAFDVALHFGTLLAILVFFFKDFLSMFIEGMTKGLKTTNGKIMWYIVIATIPAAFAGLLFSDMIDNYFRQEFILISLILILIGIVIYYLDITNKQDKSLNEITFKDIILIGLSQSLALIPGFSRSGTTIAIARTRGIKREDAAKFSFYLSVPVVAGAVLLMVLKDNTISIVIENLAVFISGILVSFVTGLICIKFLLQYLRKNDFKLFMIYRIILGLVALFLLVF